MQSPECALTNDNVLVALNVSYCFSKNICMVLCWEGDSLIICFVGMKEVMLCSKCSSANTRNLAVTKLY